MLKMAWRNLWRNKTRVAITVSAIAMSYAMFLVSMGVSEDSYRKLEEGAAIAAGGSVLIHGEGYWENQLNDYTLNNVDSVLEIVKKQPNVEAVAQRMLVIGLASSSTSSAGVRLQGMVVEDEKPFQDFSPHTQEKKFFDCEESPIVLGKKVANDLDVELGDRIVVTASGPDGEVARALFFLCDIVATGSDQLDGTLALAKFNDVREAFGIENGATQIGILSPDRVALAENLKKELHDTPSIEILTWDEAMPDMVGMIQMDEAFGALYGFVVFIVVVFAITNTFLMIVMERIREFGLLSALGLTPKQVATVLMIETVLLAIIGIVVGFVIGFVGHSLIAHYGINYAALLSMDSLDMAGVSIVDPIFYSTINPTRWFNATISVFLMTVASALYPAWKAARLAPAESMRFFV